MVLKAGTISSQPHRVQRRDASSRGRKRDACRQKYRAREARDVCGDADRSPVAKRGRHRPPSFGRRQPNAGISPEVRVADAYRDRVGTVDQHPGAERGWVCGP
jgi:hypothetical protein